MVSVFWKEFDSWSSLSRGERQILLFESVGSVRSSQVHCFLIPITLLLCFLERLLGDVMVAEAPMFKFSKQFLELRSETQRIGTDVLSEVSTVVLCKNEKFTVSFTLYHKETSSMSNPSIGKNI